MQSSTKCNVLIEDATVLTMDARRTVLLNGAIAIVGSRIAQIGPTDELRKSYRPEVRIDAKGGIVQPGYIDTHSHVTLHLSRGSIGVRPPRTNVGGPGEYVAWHNALEDPDEYVSALLAAVEMLRNGITTFVEAGSAFEPDAVASAADRVGIRASVTDPFVWDQGGYDGVTEAMPRVPANSRRARALLGKELSRNRDPESLVAGHIGLYGLGTGSEDLMLEARKIADDNRVCFTQHQNFAGDDTAFDARRFGTAPLVHLARKGILGPACLFTHMNLLTEEEVDAVISSGMSVVWQPANYLVYRIGDQKVSQMPRLHHKGVQVTFGADVAKAWSFGDMGFIAYFIARQIGDPVACESLLEMGTIHAAKAIRRDHELGSLEPGKKADIVVHEVDLPEVQPGLDPIVQAILVSRTKSVRTVLVNGEIVVRERTLQKVDESQVYDQANKHARKIAERASLSAGTFWPTIRY